MSFWKELQKHWYLIAASAAILVAVFVLLLIQYRAVAQTEKQTRAAMEANLELYLLEMVNDARRDILDHATHILHGIRQQRVRDHDIPGIEQAFTLSVRRYPEVENFYVVFFERRRENETWRAFKYAAPLKNQTAGKLTGDAELAESLRRAWNSVAKQSQTTLYAAVDPLTANDADPRQFFFHTVYETDSLERADDLECIGLLAFSAKPETFPAPDYLKNLLAGYQKRDNAANELLGKPNYQAIFERAASKNDLIPAGDSPVLTRKFDSTASLFPNLTFKVSAPDFKNKSYDNGYAPISILLGAGAVLLSLFGLGLTWRATRREMKVAQLKSGFLANVSHELKTPLTAIRAFGDLLHTGRAKNPERIREYGEIIKTESDRLTALINNILEMSRLERGVRRYRLEENYLCQTVAETIEIFRHSPDCAGFEIKTELPAPPVRSKFDAGAIRQALLNLLSNAVKYSDASNEARRVEVRVENLESEAVIEVRDFGIGIPLAEQRQIFKAFHRAVPDDLRAKGSGLGLAIVREIALAHGGEVFVESQPGEGSVFSLRLPVLHEIAEKNAAPNIAKEETNGSYFGHRGRAERRHRAAR